MSNNFVTVWNKIIHINGKKSSIFLLFINIHHDLPMGCVHPVGRAQFLQPWKQTRHRQSYFLYTFIFTGNCFLSQRLKT